MYTSEQQTPVILRFYTVVLPFLAIRSIWKFSPELPSHSRFLNSVTVLCYRMWALRNFVYPCFIVFEADFMESIW